MFNYHISKPDQVNLFAKSNPENYTLLCQVLTLTDKIDSVDPNFFLDTYLHSNETIAEELFKLENTIRKFGFIYEKLKVSVEYRLHPKNNLKPIEQGIKTHDLTEASIILKMSPKTLLRRIKDGSISCGYINPQRKKRPIFSEAQIDNYLNKK